MRQVGRYDIDDPAKIQGRDEVQATDRSLAAIRLNYCLKALKDAEGRVLLLGCGAGRYVRALNRTRPDLQVVGGDLSTFALSEARRADPEGHYLALDAGALPFVDSSFEAVVFFDLLEHIPDPESMLREISRVLDGGGILHYYVPLESQRGSIYHALRDSTRVPLLKWKRDHVGHVNFFTSEEVVRDTRAANLEIIEVRYGFHPFGQIHDLIDYWQRERRAGGKGIVPLTAVNAIARVAFLFTWRLSYMEDRLYDGPVLSSGIHVTALKS